MGLDQGQDHLDRDAGIGRAAAFAQDGKPRLGGEGVGGNDHVLLRLDERLEGEAVRALGRIEGVSARRKPAWAEREQKGEEDAEEMAEGVRHAPEHSRFRLESHVLPGEGAANGSRGISG